jgi:hypothetical protein
MSKCCEDDDQAKEWNSKSRQELCFPVTSFGTAGYARMLSRVVRMYFIKGFNLGVSFGLSRKLSTFILIQRKMDLSQTLRYMLTYVLDNIVQRVLMVKMDY